jgi:hypothetical protein
MEFRLARSRRTGRRAEILFRFLHQLSEGILTRKEIGKMELVIQLLLFICGEDGPIITEPESGG